MRLLAILAIVIATILIYAATKPNTFSIQRSIRIQAPPEKIFRLLNDLHNWPQWAPQDKEDPTMKRTYSGPETGVGAISDWSGSGSSGKGRMTITDSTAMKLVTVQADWARPFATRNINQFTLEPAGTSTLVTWSMHGPNLYPMKVMSVVTNLDRQMGKHFEAGLANLKVVAER